MIANRYAIYARKSSEDSERQIISIESQTDRTKEKFSDLDIVDVITEEKSAFSPYNRTKFTELMGKIDREEIDGLLAWHPDRLARNEIDGATLTYMLRTGRLKDLRFVSYSFENCPEGIMFLQLAFSQSQYSSAKLSYDVKRGLDQKVRMGCPPGLAPEGYLNNSHKLKGDRDWRIDSERFQRIEQMWQMLLSHQYSVRQIHGIAASQWEFTTTTRRKRGGKSIALSSLYRLFSNIKYAGYFYWKGELHKGAWKPMITLEQFDQVQTLLGGKGRARPKNLFFPYGIGLMRCGECGAWVTAELTRKFIKGLGRTKTYTHYHCTHRKAEAHCRQPSMTEEAVEEAIDQTLSSIQMRPAFVQWVMPLVTAMEVESDQAQQQEMEPNKRKLAGLKADLDRLKRSFYKEDIDSEFFEREKRVLIEETARTEQALVRQNPRLGALNDQVKAVFTFAAEAPVVFRTADPQRKRQIALMLGSNYSLRDKKLTIEPEKWFEPIRTSYLRLDAKFRRFEPALFSSFTGSKARLERAQTALRPDLSRFVEDVRKKIAEAQDFPKQLWPLISEDSSPPKERGSPTFVKSRCTFDPKYDLSNSVLESENQ